jgi:hypothetical protein
MAAWISFLKGETPQPMTFQQIRRSMALTFAALDAIQQNRAVNV